MILNDEVFSNYRMSILLCCLLSIAIGFVTYYLIGRFIPKFLEAGINGNDLNKPDRPKIPESLGLITGAAYMMGVFIFLPVPFVKIHIFNHEPLLSFDKLVDLTSALLCICCMILLGFVDDMLNLKWRHKLFLPAFAALPLLVLYFSNAGGTHIVVPIFMRSYLGKCINLGFLYYVFMMMLTIFCTNSINILAGVNGLEVGQSLIMALTIILNNLYNIFSLHVPYREHVHHHLLSIFLMIPFFAVSLPLYLYNRTPARVFVGDTFCYFAGMTLAVAGLLGHFSKTLLLFFIPQILNFLYSVPQLFGLIPCPRHRLPRLNLKTGLLDMSLIAVSLPESPWHPRNIFIHVLSRLKCLYVIDAETPGIESVVLPHQVQVDPKAKPEEPSLAPTVKRASLRRRKATLSDSEPGSGTESEADMLVAAKTKKPRRVFINNLTIINVCLYWGGSTSEANLTKRLLLFQFFVNMTAFLFRYQLAALFYDV